MVGARGFEPPTFCSQSRRTTRLCNAPCRKVGGYYTKKSAQAEDALVGAAAELERDVLLGLDERPVDKDIGSDVYTEAEMDAAVDAIMAESFWDEMHARVLDIHYIGDEQSENYLASVQGRFPDSGYTECAVFNTDFRSAFLAKNAAPLAPREVYTDYQWVLARADGGSWEVVTSGYA